MKIAAITEDGVTISQHFGRAPYYMVVTVENGKEVKREKRDKAGHNTFSGSEHHETQPGERHGFDAGSQSKHDAMAQSIDDCQVLIAGGMGWGAFESMRRRNIETIVTDIPKIDDAIKLYVLGKLANLMDRLH
jgi:predicted Fe-Mo cluster-binding NifX family protein